MPATERDIPLAEFYAVKLSPVRITKMDDIQSILELGPGFFMAKPVSGEGCWMDAISFQVLPIRLWELER